jgi:hypothetical protein
VRRAASITALLAFLAGCGSSDEESSRSGRLVDFSKKPPYVNSLEREQSGSFLLTTNRGFFRIDADGGSVSRVPATIEAEGKRSTLGTFLELNLDEQGELVGSGHPDQRSLPQFLGYLRSDDDGRHWRVVSRLGNADLHKIIFKHDRLYAWDAVLSAVIVSEDGGRSFSEHFTPRGLIIDFEVDPDDPDRIVAATDDQLFRSEDGGDSWRPILRAEGVRLAWPEADRLYTATKDGRVSVSEDGGDTFDEAGSVEGEPYVFEIESADELYLALSDGTILHTSDGARSFEEVFRP